MSDTVTLSNLIAIVAAEQARQMRLFRRCIRDGLEHDNMAVGYHLGRADASDWYRRELAKVEAEWRLMKRRKGKKK